VPSRTAAEAYLSGDSRQVFGEFGDQSNVLLLAAGGYFAPHARCRTWLAPEMQVNVSDIVRPAADPTETVLLALYDRQTFLWGA
jgi:hypothetical protein